MNTDFHEYSKKLAKRPPAYSTEVYIGIGTGWKAKYHWTHNAEYITGCIIDAKGCFRRQIQKIDFVHRVNFEVKI